MWRFRQDANFKEIIRLIGSTKEIERKIEDFEAIKNPRSSSEARKARAKAEKLVKTLERFEKELTRVGREWEDMYELMDSRGPAGFRLDDPAALDILE